MKKIFDTNGGDSDLNGRSGQEVEIIRELTEQEADIFEVGQMFHVRFSDGYETDVFQDELRDLDETENFKTEGSLNWESENEE